MREFRDVRRIAPWWGCLIVLVVAAFFGWVIYMAIFGGSSPGVWRYVLVPPYAVWLYLTLACLVNRRTVLATREGIVDSNGPVPLRAKDVIRRDEIAFCFWYSAMVSSDAGDESYAIGHVPGVETRDGRQVDLFDHFGDESAARNAAIAMATALNQGRTGSEIIEARPVTDIRSDPVDTRLAWVWAGIWAAAFAAGGVWEIVYRLRLPR
jgi:hypothetical protein